LHIMVIKSPMTKYQLTKSRNAYLVAFFLNFGQTLVIFITSSDSTGEQYLMRENEKIVWAEFSTLSCTFLLNKKCMACK
jgi:hypothetical protein